MHSQIIRWSRAITAGVCCSSSVIPISGCNISAVVSASALIAAMAAVAVMTAAVMTAVVAASLRASSAEQVAFDIAFLFIMVENPSSPHTVLAGRRRPWRWLLPAALLLALAALFALTNIYQTPSVRSAEITGWTPTTSLPQPVGSWNAVAHDNNLYVIGGRAPDGEPVAAVRRALLAADGTPSTWADTTPLPRALYLSAVAATDEAIFVIGGWDGGAVRREVLRAAFASSGELSAWQTVGNYPLDLDLAGASVIGDHLYVVGGWTGIEPIRAVYAAPITATGLGAWRAVSPLPTGLYRLAVAAAGDSLYAIGGVSESGPQATVYRARAQANGDLSAWQALTSLPEPRDYHRAVIHDDGTGQRLVVLGGRTSGGPTASVVAAAVDDDGALGAWQVEPSLPFSRYRFAAVSVPRFGSSYIFALGGVTEEGGERLLTDVLYSDVPMPPTPTPTPQPTATPTPVAALSLTLENSPSHWIAPGEQVIYTIAYANAGEVPLGDVLLESEVPNNAELLPDSVQSNPARVVSIEGVEPGSRIAWTVESLDVAAAGSVSYRVQRPLVPTPSVPSALDIELTGPDRATSSESIEYALTVINNAPIPLENLTVSSVLPVDAELVSPDSATAVDERARFRVERNTLLWSIDELAAGATERMIFRVRAQSTLVFSQYRVRSESGAAARGRRVVVTTVDGLPPPAAGDGVFIINNDTRAQWRSAAPDAGLNITPANEVRNPELDQLFLPVVLR